MPQHHKGDHEVEQALYDKLKADEENRLTQVAAKEEQWAAAKAEAYKTMVKLGADTQTIEEIEKATRENDNVNWTALAAAMAPQTRRGVTVELPDTELFRNMMARAEMRERPIEEDPLAAIQREAEHYRRHYEERMAEVHRREYELMRARPQTRPIRYRTREEMELDYPRIERDEFVPPWQVEPTSVQQYEVEQQDAPPVIDPSVHLEGEERWKSLALYYRQQMFDEIENDTGNRALRIGQWDPLGEEGYPVDTRTRDRADEPAPCAEDPFGDRASRTVPGAGLHRARDRRADGDRRGG